MRKLILILLLIPFISLSQKVKFKTIELYDRYEKPPAEEKRDLIVFDDSKSTLWGELGDCGSFEITNEKAYSGNNSIKLSWNKSPECGWIGFGNSFSNWGAFDLSKIRNSMAVSFFVRTQEKEVSGIPFVLAFEDMSGGGSYLFTDAGTYLYGLNIDTTWKQMIVPVWDFPVIEEEFDVYSVRQMQVQLEGGGSYYIDDLRLIDYSKEEFVKMRADVEEMKPKGNPNQTIYTEGNLDFDAFGVGKKHCHELKEITDSTSNTFISWKYDGTDCNWKNWGINWNDWYQANFRGIENKSELRFKVKTINNSKFKIKLEDFRYHSSELNSSTFLTSNQSEWTQISIPLSKFNLSEKGFVMDQIRQLTFVAEGKGEVFLDDIEIVEIK